MSWLGMVNLVAAIVIFIHCVCRLSVRRWAAHRVELWANAIMVGGAVGVIALSPQYGDAPSSEVVIHIGLALLFSAQTWRAYRAGVLFQTRNKGRHD